MPPSPGSELIIEKCTISINDIAIDEKEENLFNSQAFSYYLADLSWLIDPLSSFEESETEVKGVQNDNIPGHLLVLILKLNKQSLKRKKYLRKISLDATVKKKVAMLTIRTIRMVLRPMYLVKPVSMRPHKQPLQTTFYMNQRFATVSALAISSPLDCKPHRPLSVLPSSASASSSSFAKTLHVPSTNSKSFADSIKPPETNLPSREQLQKYFFRATVIVWDTSVYICKISIESDDTPIRNSKTSDFGHRLRA
uniref:Uncharacterized protein n=1 Tax=Glossina brevipalpis TaxID=37001 RepID=A0A1A9WS93_9MUSC